MTMHREQASTGFNSDSNGMGAYLQIPHVKNHFPDAYAGVRGQKTPSDCIRRRVY
jgi:hypothetical protein